MFSVSDGVCRRGHYEFIAWEKIIMCIYSFWNGRGYFLEIVKDGSAASRVTESQATGRRSL